MIFDLDKALGVHVTALNLRAERATRLSRNLANADTPGYKATDIDFKEALKEATQGAQMKTGMKTTHRMHIQAGAVSPAYLDAKYRVPVQPSLDGNTVEEQVEKAEFAENALQYQATLRFLDGRIKGLLTAIKGE